MERNAFDIAKHYIRTLQGIVMYFPRDVMDSFAGRRDTFTPPRRLWFVGSGDFGEIGREFFKYFVDLCGLQPHHKVLDVGCGNGRMAVPMLKYLKTGSYEGFDIVPAGIKWSTRVITSRYPNFHFQLADIYNKVYNPMGRCAASEYRFPYADATFDFILLTSVVTHLLPQDADHYLAEVARVLKPQGKTFITWFLLNEESKRQIEQKHSTLDFCYRTREFWSISQKSPEHAVAYDSEFVRGLFTRNGLQIEEPIRYGAWPGRKEHLSYQDIVVAHKV